jgi:2-polyprenyl-3-methyl-5-hydroxy-6-metoxy-1,4-benzoquinol methylase
VNSLLLETRWGRDFGTTTEVRRHFDQWTEYEANLEASGYTPWLRKFFGELPQGTLTLCDFACGPGPLAQDFLARGYELTGIDISTTQLRQARLNGYQHTAIHDLLHDWPAALGVFDIVTCFGALGDYIPVPYGLPALLRHLKPGGYLGLTVESSAVGQLAELAKNYPLHFLGTSSYDITQVCTPESQVSFLYRLNP